MAARRLAMLIAAAVAACVPLRWPALAQESPGQSTDTHALFRAVGALYQIDPQLLEAIARVESAGDAAAVSRKGAQGMMQLMPATARRFEVGNSFDPVESALGAARFLDYLQRTLSRDSPAHLTELLAAYNAGERAVIEHRGVPPYPETREYVRRVLLAYLLEGAPLASTPHFGNWRSRSNRDAVSPDSSDPLQQMELIRHRRAVALRRSANLDGAQAAR